MDTTLLFTVALQLPDPWRVSGVELRDGEGCRRELHITIGFGPGPRFSCPHAGCGRGACPMHDVRDRVAPVTCDMGPGFAKGIRERPPDAARVIDRFHVVRHANGAVDKVRRTEAGRNPLLRRTTYPWPRNEEGLTGLRLETQA